MTPAYVRSQLVLGVLLVAVGLTMLTTTVAAGGGPLSLGAVVGGSFTVLGLARAWLVGRPSRESR